jgi:hypothetical protein
MRAKPKPNPKAGVGNKLVRIYRQRTISRLRWRNLAEHFLVLFVWLRDQTEGYSSLTPLQRRRRAAESLRGFLAAMVSAHSAFSSTSKCPELEGRPEAFPSEMEGPPELEPEALLKAFAHHQYDDLAPFMELQEALEYLDAKITAPILSHTRASADANQRLLAGKTRGRRERMIGAWAVATVLKLHSEGTKLTQAKRIVANAVGVSVSTIEKWCTKYRLDNAEFALDHDGRLFQRLRWKVEVCFNHANEYGISGDMMCRYFKTRPEFVRQLSACQARIETSASRKKNYDFTACHVPGSLHLQKPSLE